MSIEKPQNLDEFASAMAKFEGKPVLVDFFATWCPPCVAIKPYIQELATEYEGKVGFIMVDVDGAGDVAEKYGIECMPTFMLFVNGEKIEELKGANREKLLDMVKMKL